MTEHEYFKELILGKGKKVKELVSTNLLMDQITSMCALTGMNAEEVFDLTEIQFEAILNRMYQ